MLRMCEARLALMGCGVLIAIGCGCSHRGDAPAATQYRNPPGQPTYTTSGDIISAVSGSGAQQFTTLLAALQATDLTETLEGPGPFTLLAPTNQAFADLPAGALDDLLKPENKQKLRRLLLLHIIPGSVDRAAATRSSSIKTLSGEVLTLEPADGGLRIGNPKRMTTLSRNNLSASNGVVAPVAAVLMP